MLPWLEFVPDRVVTAPPVAVARLAEQLKVGGTEIGSYGRRAQTRTDGPRVHPGPLRGAGRAAGLWPRLSTQSASINIL
jgi:hypothetical protein